jgi:hypothetical protein
MPKGVKWSVLCLFCQVCERKLSACHFDESVTPVIHDIRGSFLSEWFLLVVFTLLHSARYAYDMLCLNDGTVGLEPM